MERIAEKIQVSPQATEVGPGEKDRISQPQIPPDEQEYQFPERELSRRQLINKLNNLNFQERPVHVVFRHNTYDREITLKAIPQPCQDKQLACRWVDSFDFDSLIESYRFQLLSIPKDQQLLEVEPVVKGINEKQITFTLPETCREVSARKRSRHQCSDVSANLLQSGATFQGNLVDYGVGQFRVGLRTAPPQTFGWIDEEIPVAIVLSRGGQTLYSGECRIIRHDEGLEQRFYTLEPTHNTLHRFQPREFRCTRHRLSPPPDVVFVHPLFGKTIYLKTVDISGSGFSVEEEQASAVLLPGLIIPDLEIIFGNGSSLRCMAQVVHCNPDTKGHHTMLRCGLAILDIAERDQIRLIGLMHQATDTHAYVCNKIDMDALWDFFFETGFIYPEKYEFIKANKEIIKATYEKVYNQNSGMASHFVYQDKGRILAHMAMLRFYDTSWLIHHHAAIRSSYNRGGLIVLNQVGRFINESHRLQCMKMDYVFCYYRPKNKFPAHVFGGAARNIKNPKICSLDTFAFYYRKKTESTHLDLPSNWTLEPIRREDIEDLQTFYEETSGGLMLQALHLSPERFRLDQLKEDYLRMGMKRERRVYALRYRDTLCAVIMVNLADMGLNMSNLTNSVTVIAVNPDHLSSDPMQKAIDHITLQFEAEEIPILLYPQHVAGMLNADSDKSYNLWVYNTQNLDYYFRFLKRLLKFIQH